MKNPDRNARSADGARGILERAGPCRNADSVRAGRPQGAMVQNRFRSLSKPVHRMAPARCAAILKPSEAHINSLAVAAHRRGARSSSMVGMNSETVGWMCIARRKTVDGAFAYMTSRIQGMTP